LPQIADRNAGIRRAMPSLQSKPLLKELYV
jgi:hypothetical protein